MSTKVIKAHRTYIDSINYQFRDTNEDVIGSVQILPESEAQFIKPNEGTRVHFIVDGTQYVGIVESSILTVQSDNTGPNIAHQLSIVCKKSSIKSLTEV